MNALLVAVLLVVPSLASAVSSHHRSQRKPPAPAKPVIRHTQETLPVPASPLLEEDRLSGDWGGLRNRLSDHGLDLAAIYKGEVHSVLAGGTGPGTVYLDNLDLRLSVDAEKLMGLKGGSAFFYGLANHGKDPSHLAGDAQVTSNIETKYQGARLYEAWYQQLFYKDQASVLVGLHDLNSEFYLTETSGLFLNSSFGVGQELSQTGVNGPSIFPVAAPALRLRAEPSPSFYLQTALFNAKSGDPAKLSGTKATLNGKHGLLSITEAAYQRGRGDESRKLPGKYGAGFWSYTRTFDHQVKRIGDEAVPVASNGAYALLEQAVTDPASVFLRAGIASSASNRFVSNWSMGFVWAGLLGERDRLGLALTRVRNGDEYMSLQESLGVPATRTETAYELTYRIELGGGISVQPDFQYVRNPNTDPAVRSAQVGALRLEISF